MTTITLKTAFGTIIGNETGDCREFLGIPYAAAERFRYAEPIESYEEPVDARAFGNACPQYRQFFPHLDNPERLFYYREFREGLSFHYDEDCLNLNIYAPKTGTGVPVLVFIHGGGFNSGCNAEEPFRGESLAKRGILSVFINYRVGILGWLTHEEIMKEYGRNGNFGLDDMVKAVRWVKSHISAFGGNPENITLCGQSAGAISIQLLCLNHENEGLFQRVLMMSGAGEFPSFAQPKPAQKTEPYWKQLAALAGCGTLEELRKKDIRDLLGAEENLKRMRRDALYNTMPVIDGVLVKDTVTRMIRDPLPVGYMLGYTNNDMYAPLMAYIGNQFGRKNHAYIYFFDIDAPGDHNGAFHSCDLRYVFGRLEQSWRPYGRRDRAVSEEMQGDIASYVKSGDPNGEGRPAWKPAGEERPDILCFRKENTAMGTPSGRKLLYNMIRKGNPTA